jgi:hypothetical protein
MRRAAVALVVLALGATGAAAADDVPAPAARKGKLGPEIARCAKRVRTDERQCVKIAVERCRVEFERGLEGCYGSKAECARDCIAAQATCRQGPGVDQEGCKLACGSDQKVANQRCKVEPDPARCRDGVRMKALECKQRCAAKAAPALQGCMRRFDDCLAVCVPPES